MTMNRIALIDQSFCVCEQALRLATYTLQRDEKNIVSQ